MKPQTAFMKELYEQYEGDLSRAWVYQAPVYRKMSPNAFFDDVECEWLYLLVRHLQPEVCVEVGSGVGWSTSWILRALEHNGSGVLVSVDPQNVACKFLPESLVDGRWQFIEGQVEDHYEDLPDTFEFLLIDSNHNEPFVSLLMEEVLPRVESGGFGCVHDVYALAEPAHGEALAVFRYLEAHEIEPFSPASAFTQSFKAIQRVRKKSWGTDHPCDRNPLLIFQQP